MKWFIGFITVLIGAFLVIKTEVVYRWFGRVAIAEKYFGTEGGSRLFYKLLGVLMIVIALLAVTGILGAMIMDFFGPLFGVFRLGGEASVAP